MDTNVEVLQRYLQSIDQHDEDHVHFDQLTFLTQLGLAG